MGKEGKAKPMRKKRKIGPVRKEANRASGLQKQRKRRDISKSGFEIGPPLYGAGSGQSRQVCSLRVVPASNQIESS